MVEHLKIMNSFLYSNCLHKYGLPKGEIDNVVVVVLCFCFALFAINLGVKIEVAAACESVSIAVSALIATKWN